MYHLPLPQLIRLVCSLLGLCLAVACSAQERPTPTPMPAPTAIPSTAPPPGDVFFVQEPAPATPASGDEIVPTQVIRSPIVMVVWSGAQADQVFEAIEAGELPHFAWLAKQGLRANAVQSVDPSLSAPAQASLISGALPGRTGMVADRFHNPNDDFYWQREGRDAPLEQAEPIWVAGSRAGLQTAALFISGATTQLPGQAADYVVSYGERLAYSSQQALDLQPTDAWENAPITFSPAQQGSFYIPQVARIDVLVMDGSDDQQVNYDQVWLNTSPAGPNRTISAHTLLLELGEWGSLTLLPSSQAGADFLIQQIEPNQVVLYHSNVYQNAAAPRPLLQALNQQFGFFPPSPDLYALQHGWITPDDYIEMLERSARWMAQVSAWVHATYQPDLLITLQEAFEAANQAFMLVDSRQTGYDPELVRQYATYRRHAARIADEALEIILRPLNLGSERLLISGDRGAAAVHTTVNLNTVLERAGLLMLDGRNFVQVEASQALAAASGGAAHIYINVIGREKDGIVPEEKYLAVQERISDLLRHLADPQTGAAVFERVLTRQELATLGLEHSNSGDIFVQAVPGYALDDWRGADLVFEPSGLLAGSGYDSALTPMRTFFIAAGPGIASSDQAIPPFRIVDLAPTLAELLDIPLTANMDGQLIAPLIAPLIDP